MLQSLVILGLFFVLGETAVQPNIILIVADDMGWNDVGFHGSNQIPTPNIDALAYNGIILNQHYVLPICTPSRASLMTGKYAIHTGMQGYPLAAMEPRALPPGKLMPEYLKDLGYSTNLIGKWHLGHSRFNETPTERGFDTHIGYYTGFISYYDFLVQQRLNGTTYNGYDMRRNKETSWEDAGQYATDFFTNEAIKMIQSHPKEQPLFLMMSHLAAHTGNNGKLLEAPQEEINKMNHIIDAGRRTYAAMVTKLDESIGRVTMELRKNGMLDNSIIVFMSDNGAPTVGEFPNQGSNYPLRGVKETLWEGGVRGAAFIWSPLLQETPRVSTDLMHITDWLPTLLTAAGGDVNALDPEADGVDQWSSLVYNLPTARAEVLLNIDEKYRNAALRFNNWKIILGSVPNHPEFNSYYGESGKLNLRKMRYNTTSISQSMAAKAIQGLGAIPTQEPEYVDLRKQATVLCLTDNENKMETACNPEGGLCLYDLSSDPCEEHDLAKLFPQIVKRMKRLLVEYRSRLVLQTNAPPDLRADPKNFNYTWSPWLDGVIDPPVVKSMALTATTTMCSSDKCDF